VDERKIKTMIGFAHRARRVSIGYGQVLAAMQRRKNGIILFAQDATDNLKHKVLHHTPENTRYAILPIQKSELGDLLGRDTVGVLWIDDPRFTKPLKQLIPENKWIKPIVQPVKKGKLSTQKTDTKTWHRKRNRKESKKSQID